MEQSVKRVFRKTSLAYSCVLYNMKTFTHPSAFSDPAVVTNCDWSCDSSFGFATLHLPSNSACHSSFHYAEGLLPPHLTATQATGI